MIKARYESSTRGKLRRQGRWFILAGFMFLAVGLSIAAVRAQDDDRVIRTASGPVVIDGDEDVSLDGLHITSDEGDCLIIRNAKRITLINSEVGPCKGRGVVIDNSSDVRILDSYVHPEFAVSSCCDKGNAVYAYGSSNLLIHGNVIAYGETNVELRGVKDAKVIGNFLLNPLGPYPRGQQVQVWSIGSTRSSDILVESNYALAAREGYKFPEKQEDAMNVGFADRVTFRSNHIRGGRSPSGCGLLVDNSANSIEFLDNTLIDTGQCGIGVGSGTNHVVDGNRIFNHGVDLPKAGNTALYVWKQYGAACGPVKITNNVAVLKRPNGTLSSYWDGGGCGPVTLTNNTFDKAAIDALSPLEDRHPPPSIPPLQHTKRAATPYSD